MNNFSQRYDGYAPESHSPHNVRTTSPHMGGLGGRVSGDFRPISMLKGDLAMMYFPGSTRETALRRLGRWLEKCRPLREALEAAGYTPMQKCFTARQVRLIVEYFGLP